MLAALPVRLVPGLTLQEPPAGLSPLVVSLAVAWACVLVAVAAVLVLLNGALSLSERRAAFVSAVTHELRTPLTTLRMYSEMLARGMLPTEEKRQRYLQTLHAEADRLGHLVDNVLAYSRLERGRDEARARDLALGELLGRVEERLERHTSEAGLTWVSSVGQAERETRIRTDPTAIEQILFNLVDNACKYAAQASDRRVHLEALRSRSRLHLRVRDHGPGIPRVEARRLFRAFSKSSRDAANTAPGVGLGLALSRRLARRLGGDLRLESGSEGGASFVLALPVLPAYDGFTP
jgi:signal transduction histidine kinase